jgi:hypothetical protein
VRILKSNPSRFRFVLVEQSKRKKQKETKKTIKKEEKMKEKKMKEKKGRGKEGELSRKRRGVISCCPYYCSCCTVTLFVSRLASLARSSLGPA